MLLPTFTSSHNNDRHACKIFYDKVTLMKWGIKTQIRNVEPKPYEKLIFPAISFEVEITHQKFQEAITNVDGWLESDDGKAIAGVVVDTVEKSKTDELGAKDSSFDSKFIDTVYKATLIAQLTRKAVEYIEKRRMENEKRDVYLTLNLNVRSIVSTARVSHMHEVDHKSIGLPPRAKVFSASGRRKEGKLLAYGSDSQFSTQYSNLWIISGEGSPVFLCTNVQTLRKEGIRINSVDWIHDYAPKLELGEYFIVEVPKGKATVKKAWEYVEEAEKCARNGNSKGVYASCREVGKVLNGTIQRKYRNNPIIKKWKRAIEKFNTLTSADLHEEDIIEQNPKGEIFIGRPETEHILIVSKALIKYAQELLQEKG